MPFVKIYWFSLVNVAVFIGSLVFYTLEVSDLPGKVNELDGEIQAKTRVLNSLSKQKPTAQWDAAFLKNKEELGRQLEVLHKELEDADELIERYFSISGGGILVSTPPSQGIMLIYKEKLASHWDQLRMKYAHPQEGKNSALFECSSRLLQSIEPSWLHAAVQPPNSMAVTEAQKRYWLTRALMEILAEAKIESLKGLRIGKYKVGAKFNQKNFWIQRDIEIEVEIDQSQVVSLMKLIHKNALLFRTVAFAQKNIRNVPEDVSSDTDYIILEKESLLKLNLKIRHYDFIGVYDEMKRKLASTLKVSQ